MPRRTHEEYSRALNAVIAKYGITEVQERESLSTTTFDVILRQRRAESPASSGKPSGNDSAPPSNARRTGA